MIDLELGGISTTGELINLEILNIRDPLLEVLPVLMGKLINLIMFRVVG